MKWRIGEIWVEKRVGASSVSCWSHNVNTFYWSHNVNTFYWSHWGPTINLNIWIVLNWIRVMCVAFSAIFKVVIANKWERKNGWLLLSKVEKGRWKMRLGHFGRHHTWCWLWLDCMYLSDVYICQRRRGYCVRYTYIAPQFLWCGPSPPLHHIFSHASSLLLAWNYYLIYAERRGVIATYV